VASAGAATQMTFGNQVIESIQATRDGRHLLFDSNLSGFSNIYRMPIEGGKPEQLTHESFHVFVPDLSPDGKLLAYHSFRRGERDVEVKPLDGGPVEYVSQTPLSESFPFWSPDGSRLLFFDQYAPNGIFISTRLGPGRWSEARLLTRGTQPRWSPDGKSILFLKPGTFAFTIIPVDSGAERVVYTPPPGEAGQRGAFSADGRTIYSKRHDRDSQASFWAIPIDGGAPRMIVRFSDPARPSNRAEFATDGKRLYFTMEERQSNVWVADVLGSGGSTSRGQSR
jgi:hypothetical protein